MNLTEDSEFLLDQIALLLEPSEAIAGPELKAKALRAQQKPSLLHKFLSNPLMLTGFLNKKVVLLAVSGLFQGVF